MCSLASTRHESPVSHPLVLACGDTGGGFLCCASIIALCRQKPAAAQQIPNQQVQQVQQQYPQGGIMMVAVAPEGQVVQVVGPHGGMVPGSSIPLAPQGSIPLASQGSIPVASVQQQAKPINWP